MPEGQVEAIGVERFGKARLLLATPVGSGWFLLGEPIGVGLGRRPNPRESVK